VDPNQNLILLKIQMMDVF